MQPINHVTVTTEFGGYKLHHLATLGISKSKLQGLGDLCVDPHIYGRFGDRGSLKLRGPQNFMTPSVLTTRGYVHVTQAKQSSFVLQLLRLRYCYQDEVVVQLH